MPKYESFNDRKPSKLSSRPQAAEVPPSPSKYIKTFEEEFEDDKKRLAPTLKRKRKEKSDFDQQITNFENDISLIKKVFDLSYGLVEGKGASEIRVYPGESPLWSEMGIKKTLPEDDEDSESDDADDALQEDIETEEQRKKRHERALATLVRRERRLWGKIDDDTPLKVEAPVPEPRPAFQDGKKQIGPYRLGSTLNHRGVAWDAYIPASINTYLLPHQRNGVQFLFDRYADGEGGILLDDMGMGKTIQVIAFLTAIRRLTGGKQKSRAAYVLSGAKPGANEKWPLTLILAPAAVLENWAVEIAKWSYLEYRIADGKRAWQNDARNGYLDVVIMSHTASWQKEAEVNTIPWKCVVVDEIHIFKNDRSNASAALMALPKSIIRIGLTGTAIQNDLQDAYNLTRLVCPHLVPSYYAWNGLIRKLYLDGMDLASNDLQEENATIIRFAFNRFFRPRFSLRRSKALIAHQLPLKKELDFSVAMTHDQWTLYNFLLDAYTVQDGMVGRMDREDPQFSVEQRVLFFYLHKLRAVSNHAALVFPTLEDQKSPSEDDRRRFGICRNICGSVFARDKTRPKTRIITEDENHELCGKWERLLLDLDAWKEEDGGSKVLVFSHSLDILRWMKQLVRDKKKNYKYVEITGDTKNRQEVCDNFNTDPSIFMCLISITAGGTGLNLTGANRVIIFDPMWNPSAEQQAMDRAHRIGQKRDVLVHRYYSARSIEETIYYRQRYKLALSDGLIDGKEVRRQFEGVKDDVAKPGALWGAKNLTTPIEPKVFNDALLTTLEKEVSQLLLRVAAQQEETPFKTETAGKRIIKPDGDDYIESHLRMMHDDPGAKMHLGTDFAAEQFDESRLTLDAIDRRRIERYGSNYRDTKASAANLIHALRRKNSSSEEKSSRSASSGQAEASSSQRPPSSTPRNAGLRPFDQPDLTTLDDADLEALRASYLVQREANRTIMPSFDELPVLLGYSDMFEFSRIMSKLNSPRRQALLQEAFSKFRLKRDLDVETET